MRKQTLRNGLILLALFGASIVSTPAEDYGLDVLVTLGAPGCTDADGGRLDVTNTNVGAALDVSWHGFTTSPSATPNLLFDSTQGTCSGGKCQLACPTDPGECDHAALNPPSCTECLCEIGDHRMVLDSLGDNNAVDHVCNYPSGCAEGGAHCDNPNCNEPEFCSELVGGSGDELGIIVEIHRISFDEGRGQCWLDLEDVILDDETTIDVVESEDCP